MFLIEGLAAFLFILESIGTAELGLIMVIALILLGPRKLPFYARKIGKTINDFKRTSNDFRRTWEKEAGLNEFENEFSSKTVSRTEVDNSFKNINHANLAEIENDFANRSLMPTVKEIDPLTVTAAEAEMPAVENKELSTVKSKRSWL